MTNRDKIYVGGAWVASEGTGTIEVIDANTEEVMGSIPEGTAGDVDRAVAAAKAAFETWGYTDREERGKYLQAIAEGLAERSEEIAKVISREVGMPELYATLIQAGLPAGNMALYTAMLDTYEFEETVGNSLIVREPIGVVGAITPWNYPLHQICAKVAPAMLAGATLAQIWWSG